MLTYINTLQCIEHSMTYNIMFTILFVTIWLRAVVSNLHKSIGNKWYVITAHDVGYLLRGRLLGHKTITSGIEFNVVKNGTRYPGIYNRYPRTIEYCEKWLANIGAIENDRRDRKGNRCVLATL